jgi:porphobilinogen synthase
VHPGNLIYPIFVSELVKNPEPIKAMPRISNYPVKQAATEADGAYKLGVPAVLLFGTPAVKDAGGSSSLASDGIVQQAVQEIKSVNPEIVVVTDVCLCAYTDHGHCGIVRDDVVDNDATLEMLAQQALSHARAGADMVAPSDMMDGRVQVIRQALDDDGFELTAIMSYAAKYCSAFYGPFREAAGSTPQFGDRSSYQLDPANSREAMKELELDLEEGADILLIKPALAYLDVIRAARERFDLPIAAYSVSGEYTMIKLAADAGIAEEKRLVLEIVTAIKRAGADIIISYHAPQIAEWLG